MSRALAAADRRALDAYSTPDALADAICARLARASRIPATVVEPSAGRGPFVRAARRAWPKAHVIAVEVDPNMLGALGVSGAHTVVLRGWEAYATQVSGRLRPRLIVGNPPYRQAQAHIEAALRVMRPGDTLAFLLRINFLGSSERVPFWKRCGLSEIWPIAPRPSFTGGGSDGTEYAVFIWRHGQKGPARIGEPLTWKPQPSSLSDLPGEMVSPPGSRRPRAARGKGRGASASGAPTSTLRPRADRRSFDGAASAH